GYQVASDAGLLRYGQSLGQAIGIAKQFSAPLDQLVTVSGTQLANIYSLFYVVVDHLLGEVPGHLQALTTYYRALGAGMAWPDAFAAAFGRSVAAFYADVAAFRAQL